ncbi:unnamed protein product [Rhizophagus irregularis]|nr:unnamed protein product [Rhizophagus irregularis]
MVLKYIYTGELDLTKQSGEDILVRPYKTIIPYHIYEELEEFYYKKALPKTMTLPPRTGKSGSLPSTIIKPKLDIHNMKISRVTNSSYSVYDCYNYSGFFSFGNILFINGQNLHVGFNIYNYENIFGESKTPIEEIEVFSVVKK